jgi:sarcosine oxidase subunit gamma
MIKKGPSKMSDAVTALKGAKSAGYVSVAEAKLTGMVTLRGDFASKSFATAVKSVFGVQIPDTRQLSVGAKCTVLWMSPDELMVVCDYAAADDLVAQMTAQLGEEHALVVNVSDARAIFDVSGAQLREVIAKEAPVDMSAFGVGEVRRTRFAQIAAAFWLETDDHARVICFRSVAEYMFNLLKNASKPGYEVGQW